MTLASSSSETVSSRPCQSRFSAGAWSTMVFVSSVLATIRWGHKVAWCCTGRVVVEVFLSPSLGRARTA